MKLKLLLHFLTNFVIAAFSIALMKIFFPTSPLSIYVITLVIAIPYNTLFFLSNKIKNRDQKIQDFQQQYTQTPTTFETERERQLRTAFLQMPELEVIKTTTYKEQQEFLNYLNKWHYLNTEIFPFTRNRIKYFYILPNKQWFDMNDVYNKSLKLYKNSKYNVNVDHKLIL